MNIDAEEICNLICEAFYSMNFSDIEYIPDYSEPDEIDLEQLEKMVCKEADISESESEAVTVNAFSQRCI